MRKPRIFKKAADAIRAGGKEDHLIELDDKLTSNGKGFLLVGIYGCVDANGDVWTVHANDERLWLEPMEVEGD